MKTFIIALFGLALLASDAAWAGSRQVAPKPPETCLDVDGTKVFCPATKVVTGTCNAKKAILVILVTMKGDVEAFRCLKVGNVKIKERKNGTVPPELTKIERDGTIGHIRKHTDGTGDPCIEYTIGGQSRVFCW